MDESEFIYVRCVYSVTLAMTYLRFMQFFFAEKNMGPKVIMIRRMVWFCPLELAHSVFFKLLKSFWATLIKKKKKIKNLRTQFDDSYEE